MTRCHRTTLLHMPGSEVARTAAHQVQRSQVVMASSAYGKVAPLAAVVTRVECQRMLTMQAHDLQAVRCPAMSYVRIRDEFYECGCTRAL
jgi:hypothetical protein